MTGLQGKIAVVTGASRSNGIGTAICRALAKEGADIFFTHWSLFDETDGSGSNKDWPFALAKELRGLGVRVEQMEADLSEPDAPLQILDTVEKVLGVPTILINNATHCTATGFRNLQAHVLDQHYAVNNRGTILLSTEFAKRFERAGCLQGRIVNLVSKGPDPNNLAYLATKRALIAITEPLSVALAPLGIPARRIRGGCMMRLKIPFFRNFR